MRCLQSHSSDHKDYAKYYLKLMFTSLCVCEERNGNFQTDCDISGTNQEPLVVRAGVCKL